jgi:Acetyl-coenzyme A synthetase N-terminus
MMTESFRASSRAELRIQGGGMSRHARPSETHIQNLLQSVREIHAPEHLKREARLKDYESEYKRSIEDPGGFWDEIAKELHWHEPWTKTFEWNYPTLAWFLGAATLFTTAWTAM